MKIYIKSQLYIVPLLMALGIQQLWADITINLGSSRIVTNKINPIGFSDLNGTPVTGTISVDFIFSNDTFVRLFNRYPNGPDPTRGVGTTSDFDIDLELQTSGSGLVGFLHGTGYIFDRSGNPIPGYGITGSGSSDHGEMGIALFPLHRNTGGAPNLDLLRPLDFYGVHFDVTLPNLPSLNITGATFAFYDTAGEFGIGPNVPLDVPEPSSFALAAFGTLACLLFRRS